MNPAALPRLLRRPSFLLWLLVGFSTTVLLVSFDYSFHGFQGDALHVLTGIDPSAPGARGLHILRFLSLCGPAILGFLIGQTVHELYHANFAWNLPGLRRSVASQVVLLGVVLAVLVALGYRALGGSGNPVSLAALVLLWFLLGTGVEGSLLQLRMSGTGRMSLLVLLAAGVLVDPLYGLVGRYPWPGAIAALLLAGVFVRWAYGTGAARRRPAIPTLPLISTLSAASKERFRLEVRSHVSGPGIPWTESLAGAGVSGWVRADIYETYGYRRFSAGRILLGTAAATVLFVGIFAFQSGLEATGASADGLRFALATFLQAPLSRAGGHAPPYWLLGWILGVVTWAFLTTQVNLRLQALPYPLSRSDLSRIAYRAGLRHAARFSLTLAAFFGAAVATLLLLGYRTDSVPAFPGFVRSLAVAFVLVPFPLAFRDTGRSQSCRTRPRSRVALLSIVSVLVMAAAVAAATRWLPAWLGHSGPLVEATVLLALIAASQLGYRRWLEGYFRKADLA
jgi:hypothetical protein